MVRNWALGIEKRGGRQGRNLFNNSPLPPAPHSFSRQTPTLSSRYSPNNCKMNAVRHCYYLEMPTTLADTQNLLSDLIARYCNRVDYLMIRLEEAEGTDILLRGDKVETLSEGISIGGHIRACYKGGWGLSCFNQLSTIKDRIEEAIAAARMVGDEETLLAPIDPVQAVCILPLQGTDPRAFCPCKALIPAKSPSRRKNNCAIAILNCSKALITELPLPRCVTVTAPKK